MREIQNNSGPDIDMSSSCGPATAGTRGWTPGFEMTMFQVFKPVLSLMEERTLRSELIRRLQDGHFVSLGFLVVWM